jgi:hypothetical protein
MSDGHGYACARCGRWHDDLPFGYGAPAPAYWRDELELDPHSQLGEEQCVIEGEHFFVRGRVCVAVTDTDELFEWGVWVSLSEDDFLRMSELWDSEGREAEEPVFGWLSSDLPIYEPSTLGLETTVRTQPVGVRPLVELWACDHPLAIEQRDGISLARVQEFAETLLH